MNVCYSRGIPDKECPMAKAVRVRALTADEVEAIKRLAHSRTEPARAVERAKIVWLAHEGQAVPTIAEALHLDAETVRLWIRRFNAEGTAGLADKPRSGGPATYTAEQVGEIIAAALTNPQSLDLPFASWTLDRLEAYLNETKGIPIKRSRIDDLLLREGLRWRKQETWFGERVDPEFAEKRGVSPGSTRSHQPEA
jgi:transposase